MAQTTTWSINSMKRNTSDGGVTIVYWECRVTDDDHADCTALDGGKLNLTYDSSDPDFTPYADLTEAQVLGWVYDSLREGDETATEAKTRVETERQEKVTAQVAKLTSQADGVPW
jgi:hypothetical protein